MPSPERKAADATLPHDGWKLFGFDLPDERWLERIRGALRHGALGRLGSYYVLEEVARGAQGVVYRGIQPGTNRVVALKRMVAGSYSSASSLRRFEREVEAAASLHHPGVVTVYGAELVDGVPVYAMEWVDGLPLDAWCGAGPRSRRERLELFLKLCDAVQHAHHNGVLHRDLKPSNILVDATGQPRVLDFGLAKWFALDGDERASLTATASFAGTPAYASPEQLDPSRGQGRRTSTDIRSDVYSLGVILFELLTGARPFDESKGLVDLIRSITDADPPRASSIAPEVDDELDTIIQRALEKDRADRYQSVDGLSADVRRYLAGEPIHALPPSAWYQLVKLVRRKPLVAGLSLGLAATLLLGTILSTWALVVAREERDAALEAERSALTEADKAHQMLDLLIDMMPPREELLVARDVQVADLVDRLAAGVGERFAEHSDAQRAIRAWIAEVALAVGQLGNHVENLEAYLRLLVDDGQGESDEAAKVLALLYMAHDHAGDVEAAAAMLARAEAVWSALPRRDPERYAESLNDLATHSLNRARLTDAEAYLERAMAAFPPEAHPTAPLAGRMVNTHARLLQMQGELEEACAAFERGLASVRAIYEGDTRNHMVASSLSALGLIELELGRTADAALHLRESIERLKGRFDLSDGALLNLQVLLATALALEGERGEALQLVTDALPWIPYARPRVKRHSSHGYYVAYRLLQLGSVALVAGEPEWAQARLERSLELVRQAAGEDSPASFEYAAWLARALAAQGREDQALALVEERRAAWRAGPRVESAWSAFGLTWLGHAFRALERVEDAASCYDDAIACLREDGPPPGISGVFIVFDDLADLERARGRVDRARALRDEGRRLAREHGLPHRRREETRWQLWQALR